MKIIRKCLNVFKALSPEHRENDPRRSLRKMSLDSPANLELSGEADISAEQSCDVKRRSNMGHRNKRIWIDVGAHLGERTLEKAKTDEDLTVYAFEPNLRAAVEVFGHLNNFVVLPMAVFSAFGSVECVCSIASSKTCAAEYPVTNPENSELSL